MTTNFFNESAAASRKSAETDLRKIEDSLLFLAQKNDETMQALQLLNQKVNNHWKMFTIVGVVYDLAIAALFVKLFWFHQ